jgi:HEAT repeat protein
MAALFCVLALGACTPTPPRPEPEGVRPGSGDRPWYRGTPEMQRRIRALIAKMPTVEGAERIVLGRRIVSFGEPAVPQLVEALRDRNPTTRGTAAWLLGFLADPRAAPALLEASRDPSQLVRYEAATSLLRIGDDRGFPVLISGLEDPDPRIRAKCILQLKDTTGETLGFIADDAPDDRAAAVARWRAWAASRGLQRR